MHSARPYVHPGFERAPQNLLPPVPFRNAEQAWFWTMAALLARHEGGSRPGGRGLYRTKRIALAHARVLRTWGERGMRPEAHRPAERTEAKLWAEAMTLLEWPLRVRGIVVTAAR